MFDHLKKESNLTRILIILLIFAVGTYLLGLAWQTLSNFSDVIIILILSWLLSFVLEPIVEKIKNFTHFPKGIATLIAYLFITAIFAVCIFLFIPVVTAQIQTLTKLIPSQLESSPQFVNRFGDTLISYLNNSISIIPSALQFLFSMLLILILSFYFIMEKEKINKELFSAVPEKWHEKLKFFQTVIDNVFASFIRVQLIFGLISGIVAWIILRILNIDFAASAALLSGIFAIIPLVGPIFAIVPPVLVALLTDPTKALAIFIILLAIQQIIFNVIGPKLFSKALKLDPIIILISFLVGSKIAGPMGAIFAIPALGILTVAIKQITRSFLKEEQK
ncbi:AI-2E family transporter [Candidatus Microgenomates bacterium]|nr:MAG: AI-2E family transporter [Candidatus Microgenomates bacterium]